MHNVETSVETKSAVSSAAGLLQIPPNPHRCAILLDTPSARTTLVSIGAGHTTGQGTRLTDARPPLLLTAAQLGKAIKSAIILEDSAGAQQTFTWTEWVYAL